MQGHDILEKILLCIGAVVSVVALIAVFARIWPL
jgi:hypothetical protein